MLIHGSQIRTALVAMLLCLGGLANAQDDPSQRPLPLPERGVADLPQHMELLKRLRSLVESKQKNPEKAQQESNTTPQRPELPSPTEPTSPQQDENKAGSEKSSVQPQHLQQFQEALKNLASKLPPGFVPPDLSSVPPDQLRKAMENPAVQQQMKQMLEQFAKDGVLPKPGDNGSQAPVPTQNDDRQNDDRQNDDRQNDDRQNDDRQNDDRQNDGGKNDGSAGSLRKNESRGSRLNDRPSPSTQKEQNKPSEGAKRNPAPADGSPEDTPPLPPLPPMQAGPAGQNSPGPNGSAVDDPAPTGSEASDSANDAPPGSMRSLRSFLKKLAEDAGLKSPEPSTDSSPSNDSAASDPVPTEPKSGAATDDQTARSEPKNSLGNNNTPSTRRPLRKRDSSKPQTAPPIDSANSPAPGSNNDPSEQFPETSPQPLNRPNERPRENNPETAPGSDASQASPAVPNPAFSNPPQGLRMDPESARKQLEELQKTIERMKEMAEESDPGRSQTEERPSSNGQSGRSGTNSNDRSSNSNSVPSSTGRNDRMANRPDSDNRNGEQLPESLPDVDQFLREQLKNFKLPPNAAPGNDARNDAASNSSSSGTNPLNSPRGANPNQRRVDRQNPIDSSPRDLSMDRSVTPEELRKIGEKLRRENSVRPGNDPSAAESAKSEKPPIDIAKELEQRGFGNTLKQLVERAKEEAKKPRQPAPNPEDSQEIAGNSTTTPADMEKILKDATGAAKNADPELSQSMAKMLDGLKDDLVEIAKDARFNDPPERSRSERSMTRPSPPESNSMIDTLRKSAAEILAGPARSSNSGNTASSSASGASNAFSGEFDFTPVLVLAGVLAALAVAFFGLRRFKFGGNNAAELQFAGPPLKPADINSRADVVRAFHEFAMRSAQSVQSWWTHRTVQQAILEKAPEHRAAVETLANTYEQARYLPAEQELTPEQLESARAALQQCSRKSSNG